MKYGNMQMVEPTTSVGVVGWKLLSWALAAGGIAAGLASIVVICMMRPKTDRELAVALISTLACSLSLGCYAILKLGMLMHVAEGVTTLEMAMGVMSMGGVMFACGIPGWAVVRWTFNFINKRNGQGIDDVLKELRELKKGNPQ